MPKKVECNWLNCFIRWLVQASTSKNACQMYCINQAILNRAYMSCNCTRSRATFQSFLCELKYKVGWKNRTTFYIPTTSLKKRADVRDDEGSFISIYILAFLEKVTEQPIQSSSLGSKESYSTF